MTNIIDFNSVKNKIKRTRKGSENVQSNTIHYLALSRYLSLININKINQNGLINMIDNGLYDYLDMCNEENSSWFREIQVHFEKETILFFNGLHIEARHITPQYQNETTPILPMVSFKKTSKTPIRLINGIPNSLEELLHYTDQFEEIGHANSLHFVAYLLEAVQSCFIVTQCQFKDLFIIDFVANPKNESFNLDGVWQLCFDFKTIQNNTQYLTALDEFYSTIK